VNAVGLRSIRSKLLALFLLATLVPLGTGLVVAAVGDVRRLEQDLLDRTSKLASIVEEYSAADLAFEDPDAARQTLAKVARLEEVRGAALYSNNGFLFASYRRPDLASDVPEWVDPKIERRVDVSRERVVVHEPVLYRGQRYGTFYLEASTERVRERAEAYRRGLGMVAMGLLALYWLLAVVLQRALLRPLSALTDVARKLAATGDYSLRARKESEDELGILAETLNAMLAEIERRQSETREALKARDDFLSVASHELKTPLATLKLQTQRLQGMLASANGRNIDRDLLLRVLGAYSRQVHRLEKLVSQLLDVTRIAAGRLQLELEPVDLARLVAELTERFHDELAQAGCSIELSAPEPVMGRWDPFRLDQVLSNLIANAIKYGAGGPVEVRVAQDPSHGYVVVRDHGIGIAPREQERIFAPFERVVSIRHYGGLGLGLYITRRIVEAHGGRITVESREGEGATFKVELPRGESLPSAEGASPQPVPRPSADGQG
jgi:signal transduction histidine kinase